MNFVHIVGRLAKDPETRFTSGGQKVTTLVVASNYFHSGQEETIWWRVTLWGDRFDKMIQHFTKGKLIMVGGDMRKPEMYTDKNGAQQIGSIDVTAEYIKFVPIGRTDSQGNDGQPASSNESRRPQSAGQYTSSYGANKNSGASSAAGVHSSESSFSSHDNGDDEPLPF